MRHLISIATSVAISIAPWNRFRSASIGTQNGSGFLFRHVFPDGEPLPTPLSKRGAWKTHQTAASHYRVLSGNSTSSVTYRHFAADLPKPGDAGKR
jgi:hypothetical protein